MARAKEALKRAIAETVVPLLRSDGFKGSNPTWVRTSDRGDAAVVNVQLSPWNTRDEVRFYVNLAVAPEPWRARLDPTPVGRGTPDSWEVTDERTAEAAARDVVRRLLADFGPSPELETVLASLFAHESEVEDWAGQLQLLQR